MDNKLKGFWILTEKSGERVWLAFFALSEFGALQQSIGAGYKNLEITPMN